MVGEPLSPERERQYRSRINHLSFLKSAQYGLFLSVLLLITVIQVYHCISKYFAEPTFISSRISDQNDAEFPEITVCIEGGGFKENVLYQHGFIKEGDYRNRGNHTWQSNDTSVTPQELFDEATYSAADIIKSLRIRTIRSNAEDNYNFYANPGVSDEVADWTPQYHRSFGRCHSFFPAKELRQLGIYYIKMYGYEDLKVYLHHPGQWLDLSGRMGYKIYKNDVIQMQVTWQSVKMLDEDTKTIEKGFKCSRKERYNDCIYRKLHQRMVDETKSKCTVPYLPDNTQICSAEEERDIVFNIHYTRVTNQMGDCPNPCDFLIINLSGQNRKQDTSNNSLLYFYFQSRTMTSEENLLYTPLSLFAEIGGYVGLLMGFSIFHLADFFSALVDRRIVKYQRILDRKVVATQ